MSEEPTAKPVRALLREISRTNDPDDAPRGFFSPKMVGRITFFGSIFCLLLSAVALIAAIWGVTEEGFALRVVASLAVITLTLFAFRAINLQFE